MLSQRELSEQEAELSTLLVKLQDRADSYAKGDLDVPKDNALLREYSDIVEEFRRQCCLSGLDFASAVSQFVKRNLMAYQDSDKPLGAARLRLLLDWPNALGAVLDEPESDARTNRLLALVSTQCWIDPISQSHLNLLKKRLARFKEVRRNSTNSSPIHSESKPQLLDQNIDPDLISEKWESEELVQDNSKLSNFEADSFESDSFEPDSQDIPLVNDIVDLPLEALIMTPQTEEDDRANENKTLLCNEREDESFTHVTGETEMQLDVQLEEDKESAPLVQDAEQDLKDNSGISLDELMAFTTDDPESNELKFDTNAEENQSIENNTAEDILKNVPPLLTENGEQDSSISPSFPDSQELGEQNLYRQTIGELTIELHQLLAQIVLNKTDENNSNVEQLTQQKKQCIILFDSLNEVTEQNSLKGSAWFFNHLKTSFSEFDLSQSTTKKYIATVQKHLTDYIICTTNINETNLLTFMRELLNDGFCDLPESQIEDASVLLCEELFNENDTQSKDTLEEALENDIDLTIPADAQTILVEMFLQEAPLHIEELTEHLQLYSAEPDKMEHLVSAQRCVHTLKGAAGTIGITGLVNISHRFEDILGYLAEENGPFSKEIVNFIFRIADSLADTCEYLLGNTEEPKDLQLVLQTLIDVISGYNKGLSVSQTAAQIQLDYDMKFGLLSTAERTTQESMPTTLEAPEQSNSTASQTTANSESNLEQEKISEEAISPAVDNPILISKSPAEKKHHENAAMVRVAKNDLEKILRNVGETTVLQGHLDDEYQHVKSMIGTLDQLSEKMQKTVFEFENYIDIRAVSDSERKLTRSSVKQEEFDPLEVNRMNELHTYLNQIVESLSDIKQVENSIKNRLGGLDSIFQKQVNLNKSMESDVLRTRMIPVKTIVPRLERCVRQVSRLLNKQVDFEITGQSINIDLDVLNMLMDPLMHVLRNSVDHGIELPEERQSSDKLPTGEIALSFKQKGHSIVVSCKDDGRGIDYEKIKQKLIASGLITKEQNLPEKTLIQYLLQPGFSTSDSVTATSGRGIGMDVVSQKITESGGYLEINSKPEQGCEVVLTLPITMVSQHVLIVKSAGVLYALPTNTLIQAFAPNSGSFKTIGDKLNFFFGNENYTTYYLNNYIGGEKTSLSEEEFAKRAGVIVRTDSGPKALFVDEVLNCRDIVLKKFGEFLPHIPGVHGAATLGDGQIVAILELNELLQSSTHLQNKNADVLQDRVVPVASTNKVLIVEDSLSTRRMLEQLVSDTGYEVKTAIDGIEAIQILKSWHPDVILSDLELPRLNGLELTAHVRANDELENTPVIMITSRYTDKHREHARKVGVNAYLTKPFSETDVLSNIEMMTEVHA
ncbi:hybrid sensor histidine kinase/response regulator [Aliikangiella coralliicola]|uniref:Chemotaxis protein CheA n=1 Tax=Aliikangiella coralliicola TaxID=2592383 RepID=A0A545UHX4_9GAMM|nr:hybrid sensor histidine kinase/response regulator [Aliikangiella coralliicola]TQV89071.1 response regulator [Aliikangiella coralliicola]